MGSPILRDTGRPASPAWLVKLMEIIILKCQSIIQFDLRNVTMSINEECHSSPSVSTIPIPSAQPLKPVTNPDLWEYMDASKEISQ